MKPKSNQTLAIVFSIASIVLSVLAMLKNRETEKILNATMKEIESSAWETKTYPIRVESVNPGSAPVFNDNGTVIWRTERVETDVIPQYINHSWDADGICFCDTAERYVFKGERVNPHKYCKSLYK
jgi:hypothetical protein